MLRIVWVIFLGLAGLIGLGMSLCGGVVLVATMPYPGGAMFIAFASLAVGVLICFGAWRGLTRSAPAPGKAQESDRRG